MNSTPLRLLAVLLAAAWPARAQTPPKNPDTLVYAIIGDIDSLDPAWQYDGISHEIQYQLYETLIFFDGASTEKFVPMLATVVPSRANKLISADGLTYSFPLRQNVRFHDGSVMTPEDVRYSILRFMLTDRASGPSVLLLEPMLGRQTIIGESGKAVASAFDEATKAVSLEGGALVLRLKQPSSALLPVLAAFCPVVSKPWAIAHGGWDGASETWTRYVNSAKQDAALYDKPNGTGPFRLERWDKDLKQLVLARHAPYWRKPARLARVVFKTVGESSTRKLQLQAGDADVVLMERQYLPQVIGLEGVRVVDDLPFLEVHNVFVPNFKITTEGNPHIGSGKLDGYGIPSDFFSDLDVRKGFAYGFDYDGYIRDGYRGKGRRAHGPIPRGILGHNPRQTLWPQDPKKAEAHFRKAFGGAVWEKGFRFTLTFMEGRADRQLACQIMKSRVEALNPKFKIDVRGILWSTYLSDFAAGKLAMSNARWALDFADPHNAVHPFLHSQGHYAKRQGYSNPRADALIETALSEGDPAKRAALYHELLSVTHPDVPQIYTLDTDFFEVRRSWVKGWTYNPIAMYGYLYPVYKE